MQSTIWRSRYASNNPFCWTVPELRWVIRERLELTCLVLANALSLCHALFFLRESVMKTMLLAAVILLGSGCAEVGSERWCENMEEKPKGDWSANDAADYAKHCIFD